MHVAKYRMEVSGVMSPCNFYDKKLVAPEQEDMTPGDNPAKGVTLGRSAGVQS